MMLRRLLPILLLAAWAGPAAAHAILIDSTPALGGTMKAGAAEITLRFNSRIDVKRSRVTLTGPDHVAVVLPLSADGQGVVLHAAAMLAPGAQSLRWQVLAIDGHITRGDVPFTVEAR